MYESILSLLREKPAPYAPSSAPLWDDEHISKRMLNAHLAPNVEAASRKHDFIDRSVDWIAGCYPKPEGLRLIDLGCGPGLYAERLCKKGFNVTGVDFSRRSIDYAARSAAENGLPIEYRYADYLSIDYTAEFDAAILIYCDYGVLPPESRHKLMSLVHRALKPGGRLFMDVFSPKYAEDRAFTRTTEYCDGGFFSPKPYVCIETHYNYPETANTLEQYVVITADKCECYNTWNQVFTQEALRKELADAGFNSVELFGNAAGEPLDDKSETLCAIAQA